MVVPAVAEDEPDRVLDGNPTLVRTLDELAADGRWHVSAVCATDAGPGAVDVVRGEVAYRFEPSDQVAMAVLSEQPDVVHVHGTGFVTTLLQLRKVLPATTGLVVQHHGEPPGGRRQRWGHRLLRGRVDAWLFTGADHGQAQPFVEAGIVPPGARVVDVLEAASLLPPLDRDPMVLEGSPAVLWVGRLIDDKDPVAAVEAVAAASSRLPDVHLHLLATDRSLEPAVRAAIDRSGTGSRVHLHPAVQHGAMPAWYAAADVLLSTSRREGSGYSVIEAISAGCAPVVSDLPSHRTIVGDLAPVFPVGDTARAAALLVAAGGIGRDDVLDHAARTLTWDTVVHQLDTVYREVLRPSGN